MLILLPLLTITYIADALPRRALMGVRLTESDQGPKVAQIFANTTAETSGLKQNDIITHVNAIELKTVPEFQTTIRPLKPGTTITCRVLRDDKPRTIEFPLKEWPREKAEDIIFRYDHVESGTKKLRTVISHPRDFGTKRLPAVLYIQGIDCASVEATFPFPFANHTREFLYGLTRAGFVVMRCEKSGVGDSTGPDCNDLPLKEEVQDFANAVKKLKTYPYVDPDQVYLFGHSAGGWVGPMVAQEQSIAGIIVYGTVVRPFAEYMVENHRRNRRLRNDLPPAEIERQTAHMRQFLHHLLDERKPPSDVIKQHPELRKISRRVFPQDLNRPYNVRNIEYFRDVNALNMADVWTTLRIPTLALCGEYEARTSPFEHEYIAQIVNHSKPGYGEWKIIPKLDHGFAKHDSHSAAAKNEFKGPFGEQIVTETVQWLRKQIKRNQP